MLGKTGGRRRRGCKRMRWMDGNKDSMDTNLGKLGDGEGQGALVCCSPWGRRVEHNLVTTYIHYAAIKRNAVLIYNQKCMNLKNTIINGRSLTRKIPCMIPFTWGWWLSGKESACSWKRHGFYPWSGKIPHAVKQPSPSITTTELTCLTYLRGQNLEPILGNKRSHRDEKQAHGN